MIFILFFEKYFSSNDDADTILTMTKIFFCKILKDLLANSDFPMTLIERFFLEDFIFDRRFVQIRKPLYVITLGPVICDNFNRMILITDVYYLQIFSKSKVIAMIS